MAGTINPNCIKSPSSKIDQVCTAENILELPEQGDTVGLKRTMADGSSCHRVDNSGSESAVIGQASDTQSPENKKNQITSVGAEQVEGEVEGVEPVSPTTRWTQMRLTWKHKGDTSTWSTFDFRASFDGTKRESLVEDSKAELAANKEKEKVELAPGEESTTPKQFRIEIRKCSLAHLSSVAAILHTEKAQLLEIRTASDDESLVLDEPKSSPSSNSLTATIIVVTKRQLSKVVQLSKNVTVKEEIWYPRCVDDLNNCKNVLSSYEPNLDRDHPGFNDVNYRNRRAEIAMLAQKYRHGTDPPRVEYTEVETATWKEAFDNLSQLYTTHACMEYLKYYNQLKADNVIRNDTVPQLEDLSKYLHAATGFTLCPVSGLVSARDFLACLAFKVFPCTQYIRHHDAPMHSPEPDLIHEVLGHVVMFMDQKLADFSQRIGKASLGASDEFIVKLATLYWFTVEFGLVREGGQVKAYGAGLLSSYGELEYALSPEPDHVTFDTSVVTVQPYDDYNYQQVYFIVDSFQHMLHNFESFLLASSNESRLQLKLE
ncbi:tyrosine 3-monooxygenase-like [Convolutriloba macropyga]|uniref:tyrosine 3-monooxygenase-like n=1 Tax=Convolutriloba macropyga TaxID=536237 RepID=UPI003F5235AC